MCVSFMCMCISYEVVASSELTSVCWQYLLHRISDFSFCAVVASYAEFCRRELRHFAMTAQRWRCYNHELSHPCRSLKGA